MEVKTNLLKGKRGLIMGVANNRSIAWGIAKACSNNGADIILTYQGEAIKKRVIPLAEELSSAKVLECDVTDEKTIDDMFENIKNEWETIDFLVHAIAFSDKDELKGRYIETSKENFINTMNVSCYSLTSVAKKAEKLMSKGGSILTLTYYGSEKVMPHYNVMGVAKSALETSVKYLAKDLGKENIRVNAVSPGSIKTRAADIHIERLGLDHEESYREFGKDALLNRMGRPEEIAYGALFLASDESSFMTGTNMIIDGGASID